MSYFPSVNINLSSIQRDKLAELRPVIFIGQASGANFETKLYKDILESGVNNKFGLNSTLSLALLEAMRMGGSHDIYALPLAEEVGSVAATSTITITGSVVDTSQIILTANSDVFSISVANDDTINEIATKLTNKINNTSRRLFGASVVNNVITLTFNQKGIIGNQLKYSTASLNSNYLSTNDIVIQSTGFAGGSGNVPSIENILSLLNDDVADIFFDSYLLQDAGNYNLLKNWLNERFNPSSSETQNKETDSTVFFIEHNASYSTLYNKYNNNAIGSVPSLVVLSTENSTNYPLTMLATLSGCLKLIVTPGKDISKIMLNKSIGDKENLGVARGGMVLPYHLTSEQEKKSWSEIQLIQDLQICPIFNEDGRLVVGQLYTQANKNVNESVVNYPQQAILTAVRANCRIILKRFKHGVIDNIAISSLNTSLIAFLNQTSDWRWCAEEDLPEIVNSLITIKDPNVKGGLVTTFTYKPINALKFISMQINA
jgi:hypothetical protein